ncbi:hypothetical protein ACLOJK_029418 [Asimina triloba]
MNIKEIGRRRRGPTQGRAPPCPIGPCCIHSENDGLARTPSDDNTPHFEGTSPQPMDERHPLGASTGVEPPRHETSPWSIDWSRATSARDASNSSLS